MADGPALSHSVDTAGPSRAVLLVKNAFANLIRAFSSTAVTILLPLILVVILQPERYASWALVFTLGAFVAYFDLGVPTTVQALVGRQVSNDDFTSAAATTRSGIRVGSGVAVLCLAAAAASSFFFSALFPDMPLPLRPAAQGALILLVAGQASSLLGNIVSAYFAGQQRSHIPAAIIAPARAASMGAALILAAVTQSLVWTAAGYALPLVLGTIAITVRFALEAARRAKATSPTASLSPRDVSVRGLLSYSGPLIVWSVCMLVTTGLDLIVVARVDYAAVVPYSIAAIVVSGLSGLESAMTAPMLPELARRHELNGAADVSAVTRSFSGINGALLFATTAVLLALGPLFLPILTKTPNLDLGHAWIILALLLLGSTIHLAGTPLSLAFIATKTHTRVVIQPVIEAGANLGFSIALGIAFGAVGVALGTVIGSSVGIVLGFFWSRKLSGVVSASGWSLLTTAVIRPFVAIFPALASACVVIALGWATEPAGVAILFSGVILSALLLWFGGLGHIERRAIVTRVHARLRSARA